jgi:hypothetical protein
MSSGHQESPSRCDEHILNDEENVDCPRRCNSTYLFLFVDRLVDVRSDPAGPKGI